MKNNQGSAINRRNFISTIAFSPMFFPSLMKSRSATSLITVALNLANDQSLKNPITLRMVLSSKQYPEKKYISATAFWDEHKDPVASALNDAFRSRGLIVDCRSSLIDEGRALVFEKKYASSNAMLIYQKMWFASYNKRYRDTLEFKLLYIEEMKIQRS